MARYPSSYKASSTNNRLTGPWNYLPGIDNFSLSYLDLVNKKPFVDISLHSSMFVRGNVVVFAVQDAMKRDGFIKEDGGGGVIEVKLFCWQQH